MKFIKSMSSEDWYRRKSWSANDKQAFMDRLGRSRSNYHKSQYLRIQAYELVNHIKKPLYNEALDLLELLISQYSDKSQLAETFIQRAECYLSLNQYILALQAVEKALESQRNYPNIHTRAYQLFAEIILKLKLIPRYSEALMVIDEFAYHESFPVEIYKTARARALIYDGIGKTELAKLFANQALEAQRMSESPFKYQKKLGLVHTPDSRMHQRLLQLCS